MPFGVAGVIKWTPALMKHNYPLSNSASSKMNGIVQHNLFYNISFILYQISKNHYRIVLKQELLEQYGKFV